MKSLYLRLWYFWQLWVRCAYANRPEVGERWWSWWRRWHVRAGDAWETADKLVRIWED